MTIIGDAASEHERLQIVLFLRGRAALVREAAAKVGPNYGAAADIVAATLEANALLIEGGEHEKRSTRAPTAHPPASESPLGRATWEVWRESIGKSSEGYDEEGADVHQRWRTIALAEQGVGAPTAHPPEPKALSADDALMEKLDRLVAALPGRPDQDLVLEQNRVRWQGREYDVKDVRVSESGHVVGLERTAERAQDDPLWDPEYRGDASWERTMGRKKRRAARAGTVRREKQDERERERERLETERSMRNEDD